MPWLGGRIIADRRHGPAAATRRLLSPSPGDTTTLPETLAEADAQIERALMKSEGWEGEGLQAVVADKGYYITELPLELEQRGLHSYVAEPDRGRRKWEDNIDGQMAVYANRRRIRGARGQRLHRLCGERAERPFAHLYETGRMRRTHLRGHPNIRKRLLIHSGAFNLGCCCAGWSGWARRGVSRGACGRSWPSSVGSCMR